MRSFSTTLLVLLLLVPASAAAEHDAFALGGGEVWVGPETGGHGVARVVWRWSPDRAPTEFELDYNTDTLRVGLSRVPLADRLAFHVVAAGEYPFAGLLPDYFRGGERLAGRGFNAGYVSLTTGVEWQPKPHFVRLDVTGRRWFFGRTGQTADALQLPPQAWVLEPRIHYTYWNVAPDSSQWQPHQPFMRIEGLAAGATVGTDLRSTTRPWGARAGAFRPRDTRNTPNNPVFLVRQWARYGVTVAGPLRLQFSERAAWGWGEDDLTRDRVGGMNRYVVPVAGLPWAALLSGRYVAGQIEVRFAVPGDHELGVFADGAVVNDIERTGDLETFAPTAGYGVMADLRFGDWKTDVRFGRAVGDDWLTAQPGFSGWVSVRRRF